MVLVKTLTKMTVTAKNFKWNCWFMRYTRISLKYEQKAANGR